MPHNTASTTSSSVQAPSNSFATRSLSQRRLADPEGDHCSRICCPSDFRNVSDHNDCNDDIKLEDESSSNYTMEEINVTDASHPPQKRSISAKATVLENDVMRQATETKLSLKTIFLRHSSSSTIPVSNIIEGKGLSRGRLQNKMKPNSLLTLSFTATVPINSALTKNVSSYGCTRNGEEKFTKSILTPDRQNDKLALNFRRDNEAEISCYLSEPSYVIYWSSPTSDDIVTSDVLSDDIATNNILSDDIVTNNILSNDIVTNNILSDDIVTNIVLSDDITTTAISSVDDMDHLVKSITDPDPIPTEVILPISQQNFENQSPLELIQSLPLPKKGDWTSSANIGLPIGIRKNPINKEKQINSNMKNNFESFPLDVPPIKKNKNFLVRVFDASSLEKLKIENLEYVLSELLRTHYLYKMKEHSQITKNVLIQSKLNQKNVLTQSKLNQNAVQSFDSVTILDNLNKYEINDKNKENICNYKSSHKNSIIELNLKKNEKNYHQKLDYQKYIIGKELNKKEDKCLDPIFSFSVIDKRKDGENLPISLANRSRISSSVYTEVITGVTYTTQKIIGKGSFGYAVLAKVSECSSKKTECSSKKTECSSAAISQDKTGKLKKIIFFL